MVIVADQKNVAQGIQVNWLRTMWTRKNTQSSHQTTVEIRADLLR